MSTLTPEQRTLRSRAAAFAKHAKHDPGPDLAKARQAIWDRYRAQVDPDSVLNEQERDRRARCAMKADLARRALRATQAKHQQADRQITDSLLEVG